MSKKVVKKAVPRKTSTEIVVRVDTTPVIPTVSELAEPMRDGQKLTIPKTWLSENQLTFMLQGTPKNQVYSRKGKGNQNFLYVTGTYVQKALNFIFGWNWDFEIVQQGREGNQVWVLGKLTVYGPAGQKIIKTQYGRADIKMLKNGGGAVDFGNDLKAASTDALKKCASMLGIASDIYGKSEYQNETGSDPRDDQPQGGASYEYDEPVVRPGQSTPKNTAFIACLGPDGDGCLSGKGVVTPEEEKFSRRMYGKPLCRGCQSKATPTRNFKK